VKTRQGGFDLSARRILAVLIFSCVAWGTSATSEESNTLKIGDSIDAFTLEDQFGDPQQVDKNTALVLFSRDMEGGELLSLALKNKPPEYLPERRAIYVADISGMPGFVARLFALPKMRTRAYPMLLDREGRVTKRLPDQEDQGTLIEVDELKITNVEFFGDVGEIKARLEESKFPKTLEP
jgi:hypothetical protein